MSTRQTRQLFGFVQGASTRAPVFKMNLSVQNKDFILKLLASTHSTNTSVYNFENNKPTWFDNLPVNVLVNIFKHFNERELLKNIIPVCQHWKYVATRPLLWKNLKFCGIHIPTNFILEKIRNCNLCENIVLDDIKEPIVVIRQVCRWLPHLKHIAVRHCLVVPEGALRYLIRTCTELETLDLSGTEFKGNRFYQEISSLPNLKSINLSDNRHLTGKNLLSVVLNSQHLEELRISKYASEVDELGDEDVAFMVSNVSHQLKSLTLDAATLSDVTFQKILECSQLNRLGIYGATNLSGKLFAQIGQHCYNLTHLKIRQGHQITGNHVQELFSNNKNNLSNLKLLDLTGCWKVCNNGVVAIANCCPLLEKLSLKGCKNIISLRPICDKCLNLKHLNASFCYKLDPLSLYPVPSSLHTLTINENSKFEMLIRLLKANQSHVRIYVSLSEFNKAVRLLP